MRVIFQIPGKPFGKQRHRVSFKQRRTFNTAANEGFERTVGEIALPHFPRPLEGSVRIEVHATFLPPQSWSKKKRAELIHRPHTQRPDCDNVVKAIMDGLNRIAWGDDAQVAEVVVTKRWGVADLTVVHVAPLDPGEVDEYGALHRQIVGEVDE